ncbi:MAG: hypothetical protein A2275_13465 [Bacteroidetes bacterium RIFOXYA12_FULL_35_11]|nr:MAG: hypothetical protein A2X01_20410 [Bacteroidetes bacterium GWF2_35_48]OFY81676.1 MAG: hypothetical protein A2275_13465 [Bacteroidetes bacterium RIFOXYA12_FULL_35_11]OFY96378.1 MAG: hypothetical protein A2309_01960 [Bacteroidetes bacterium RIFOXYB2_FULL_35_7]HBX50250.1 hypothetical protein [Bacteroidales bacterium]
MKKAILVAVILVIIGILSYFFYTSYQGKLLRIAELEKTHLNENQQLKKIKAVNDSIMRVNFYMSRFRGLTDAMFYRDSLRIPLKYKVGDNVILKRDSTRAIISDIIIGGSQYDFYVKYRVLNKDRTEEDVIPELVY